MKLLLSASVLLTCAGLTACGGFKNDATAVDAGEGGSSGGDGALADSGATTDGPTGSDSGAKGDSSLPTDSGGSVDAPVTGSDSGSVGDGSTGTTGPGPLGDLPSGYCCTSNAECRNRTCVDLGGGNKMCEDECDGSQSLCNGLPIAFTCTWDDSGVVGLCVPPSGTACLPASQYTHGTKPIGACCTGTGNATSGQECLGGSCGSFGSASSNPNICSQACDSGADCPAPYQCANIGNYNICAPLADPYTCQ